ncbi:DUF2236 domain-containing protein [Mucilaginibacter hurinus]|uniref:DUF2236 domain-containing protein n=1 Tax=Mucilaginibacter hurinus TaxID=2201324 RepID=A0A367GRV0_9SPHI|nr:oxygenase MpaB family protein [Mucilaginibacter hurinus]RCH55825.1 DUF2236 domain-containing protein [Mucilaginibacter hurinus]
MNTEYFVNKHSIVRKIWGKADTVLFIFAGSAAEFALNKAVDWLYYTGRLPADPLDRLFSTVAYSRTILFADKQTALQAITKITAIHKGIEQNRGTNIPDWAYRDVLFMLIDYSIRSFELLERKLTAGEKEEVFAVFHRMGIYMGLNGLPADYAEWLIMRKAHLHDNLLRTNLTDDLYRQYKKHLGWQRYNILLLVQAVLVPRVVNRQLNLGRGLALLPILSIYKLIRAVKIAVVVKEALLPRKYKAQITQMDIAV